MKVLIKYYATLFLLNIGTNNTYSQEPNRIKTEKSTIMTDSIPTDFGQFVFKDSLDQTVQLSEFKGKFLMIDLWYTGCGACIYANNGLKIVHDSLKNANIVFLSISIDQDKTFWLESIRENQQRTALNYWAGKYAPAKGTVTLYTGGVGRNHELVKTHNPRGTYPKLFLINPEGELISAKPPRPDYEPNHLIEFIKRYL
jgi:thiol-disulfide isomerase/thioredoxin